MDHRSSATRIDENHASAEWGPAAKRIIARIRPDSGLLRRPPEALAVRVGGTTYARVLLRSGQSNVLGPRATQQVAICQVLEGTIFLIPESRRREMCGPEQIIFWDESEPARIEGIENAVLLLTFVAREVLGESGVDLNLGHSVFNPSNVLLRATARFIEGLLESDGTPDPMTARLVENLTHDMVGSLLLGSRAMLIDTLDHSARTYARAMRLMTAQRTNPAVTPATIAADLHVSLRQLQREFSRRGETVAGALRQLRAELAANVLRDPACDVLMMSQVAQHSGFTSSQQMRRVLAALGFPPPQELRRATKRENGCHHTNSGVGPLNAPA